MHARRSWHPNLVDRLQDQRGESAHVRIDEGSLYRLLSEIVEDLRLGREGGIVAGGKCEDGQRYVCVLVDAETGLVQNGHEGMAAGEVNGATVRPSADDVVMQASKSQTE